MREGSSAAKRERSAAATRLFVTWRAIALGCLLVPLNAYWLTYNVWYRNQLTGGISLYNTTVFILVALLGANCLVKRWQPRRALTGAELLVAYLMVTVATTMATTPWDGVTTLPTILTYPFRVASLSNQWGERILPLLPRWAMVDNPAAVEGFWQGRMNPYSFQVLAAWWRPALWWTSFFAALAWVLLCLSSVVRKRWSEEEKLTFPMTLLPLAMTNEDGSLWRSRGFRIGATATSAVALLNFASSLLPALPSIPFGIYHGQYTASLRPWSGIRQPYLWYSPFLIGLSYLMPLDLLLSLWVFTVIGKLQQVATIHFGWNTQTWWGPPYQDAQIWGGLIAVIATVVWLERRYLSRVVVAALRRPGSVLDDREALKHRTALLGAAVGCGYLWFFLFRLGFQHWAAAVFVLALVSVSMMVARFRAQLGPPHHELRGEDLLWRSYTGLAGRTQAGLTLLGSYIMGYRDNPAPVMVEGLRMGEREQSLRGLGAAFVLALALGVFSVFWANLQLNYVNGADHCTEIWKTPPGIAAQVFGDLNARLGQAPGIDWGPFLAMGIGAAVCALLMWLKLSVPSFPLHPVAFPLSAGGAIEGTFAGIFIAWVVKASVLRWGGLRAYRASLPIVFGVIVGEAVCGAVVALVRPLLWP